MLFTTYAFLFGFLPIVLLGWWSLRPKNVRLAFLTLASWVFYAWWDWRFLPLMVGATTVDYLAALAIARSTGVQRRRALLALSLSVNLGILFFFKYTTFFLTSLNGIGSLAGLDEPLPVLYVLLPIGISFYTFNSMSYVIDVFLRRVEPTRNILEYTTFVALFPHLIAGPIVRFTDIAKTLRMPALAAQLGRRGRRALLPRVRAGQEAADRRPARSLRRRALRSAGQPGPARGLGRGRSAGRSSSTSTSPPTPTWRSGSRCLLGFQFPQNFDSPLQGAATSRDFWRRWHMTPVALAPRLPLHPARRHRITARGARSSQPHA